ncbi:hypothetical protein BST36_30660, partial [Mycolicibacterium moriokaense]
MITWSMSWIEMPTVSSTSCSITKLRSDFTQWLEPTMSGAVARAIGAENALTFDLSNACAG